ncbi:MAG: 7TM-DISM domain-containing protein [Oligoflexus sp.]
MRRTVVFIVTLLAALSRTSSAYGLIIQSHGDQKFLQHVMEVFDNRETGYSIEQIIDHMDQFIPNLDQTILTSSVPKQVDYWFKFHLDKHQKEDLQLIYQWARPSKAYFVPKDNFQEWRQLEVSLPRYIGYPSQISLLQESGFLLVQFKNEFANMPGTVIFEVMALEDLYDKRFMLSGFIASMYGILLAMIIYNFILCLTLKKLTHIVYVLYGFFLICYIEGIFGYFSTIFEWQQPSPQYTFTAALLTSFSFLFFIYIFLDLKRLFPRFAPAFMKILFLLSSFLLIFKEFNMQASSTMLGHMILFLGPISPLFGFLAFLKGYRPALPVAISATLPIVGSMIYVLAVRGSIAVNDITMNIQLVSFVAEMVLMSLSLGYQLRLEKDDVIEQMNHGYTQLKKMVYPHQVHMIQEGHRLEDTLPVGQAYAVVIIFDIIQSTNIQHSEKRQFFQNVFRRCYLEMMEGYDNKNLEASAFRIKEMGDGFLCSVGFPFHTPSGKPPELVAVELAFRFLECFEHEREKFSYDLPIFASMGMASGRIEGFYPQSGTQSYELFGEAIILADRYEGLRKALFQTRPQSHIITLQERVFQALPKSFQDQFVCFHLNSLKTFMVRDDPGATCFYFHTSRSRFIQEEDEWSA